MFDFDAFSQCQLFFAVGQTLKPYGGNENYLVVSHMMKIANIRRGRPLEK